MAARTQMVLSLLFAVGTPLGVHAQTGDTPYLDPDGVMVEGAVLDVTTQRGLPVAEVRLLTQPGGALAWRALSNSVGSFGTPRLAAGRYRVEVSALGYTTAFHTLVLAGHGSLDLQVELSPAALRLEPIIVTVRRPSRLERNGFYERRNRGLGRSLTRAEILAQGLTQIASVFRRIGGVTVVSDPNGGSSLRMRRRCRPGFVLDGMRLGPVTRIEDVLSVETVEGIEVFGFGATPPEYAHLNCGTVLAWTREREPGTDTGKPASWGRAAVLAGFLALVLLSSN